MSASPEDRGQRGPAGSHTNGRTNGLYHANSITNSIEHDEENPNNGVPQQGVQENHGYNQDDGEGAESDVKNAGPHSAIRYNTPTSAENTPAAAGVPGPSLSSIASAVAALARQGSGTQANRNASAHGELNRVNGTGTPSTADGSPSPPPLPPQSSLPPQHSPASAGSNPHNSTGQGGSAGQAENPGRGAHQLGPSSSLNGTSQTGTEGQTPNGETRGAENSQNNSPQPHEPAHGSGSSTQLEQPDAPQSITLPTWQPDAELTTHLASKCGRVVCDGCSPHRITIPHPYIVRPPGDPGPAVPFLYPGVERGIADFSSIGGGERVRLCNPCVPDPNTAPPQPPQSSQPIIVDGRASRARPSNEPFGNYGADVRLYSQHLQLRPQDYTPSRNRSATTSAGHGQEYFSFFPYSSTSSQYPPPNAAYFSQTSLPHRRVSSSGFMYPPHIDHLGRLHGSSSSGFAPSFSGLNRPLPRIPTPEREIPEEDVCPVCHRELPSRSLSNYEALRETHINNCITSHSNYRGDQAATTTGSGNHGTPPPRTTRRTRMFPYVATEKDCVGDVECTICLEEFKVGDEMARLECFCRFHRSCIDSWFVNRPGRCPIHQHDSFGY
ncbi:hypothetical protein CHU98_g8004 [Xylaria longipes]|nr:hypothetical protein CHU98_g8004 [Xylaria longipes]